MVVENEQLEIVAHILFSLITIETAQGSVESLVLAPDEDFIVIDLWPGALDDVQGAVNYPSAFLDV